MLKKKMLSFILFMLFIYALSGCNIQTSSPKNFKEVTNSYYSLDDFDCIMIGKSTYNDLSDVFGTILVCYTSYGGICEFPMENGNYIQIKFYGSDMVIEDIYVSDESLFS